ncbi:MAG: TrmH family RNA methyltransferase [Anaerolineae bacterium]
MQITSLQNERVKYLVKLREDRRQRQRDGLMLVEGWDEISLALAAGHPPRTLINCPDLAGRDLGSAAPETLTVSVPVFEKISYRDNPDGWMAVFPTPQRSLSDLELGPAPLVIVAESVEKPGNLGAILRTADAAGVDALLVCDPRVDLYSPNVVRASRGALFSVAAVEASSAEALDFLRGRGIRVVAATPGATELYTAQDLRGPLAIAVGTEDEGLTSFWLERADARVLIPMLGRVNSLNVSIATALIVYEAVRQRGM